MSHVVMSDVSFSELRFGNYGLAENHRPYNLHQTSLSPSVYILFSHQSPSPVKLISLSRFLRYKNIKMDAPTLFKLAAFLNAISVPGHLIMGLQKVYPALNLLKERKNAGALAGARNSWDNVHVLLVVNGMFESFPFLRVGEGVRKRDGQGEFACESLL
jgi:hypothetical protein